MSNKLGQWIERAAEIYDPDYIVDVLGITSEELLQAFPEKFLENITEFDACLSPLDPERSLHD